MKDKLRKRSDLTVEILEYFSNDLYMHGIIVDGTDHHWCLNGEDDLYFGNEPPVLENYCFESNYSAEIRGGVYRGAEYTLVMAYHGCGGDPEMMVMDNSKEGYVEV